MQLGIHGRGFPEGGITALQRLVETALELCGAHSVGVSILENENESESEIFRWRAAAGQWAVHRDEVMSRDSLCGIVVDRNAALLITYPDGQSKYMRNIALPIAEALVNPISSGWRTDRSDLDHFARSDAPIRYRGPSTHNEPRALCRDRYHLNNEERLASELVATQRLQEISTHLLSEDKIELLYDGILDAARATSGTITRWRCRDLRFHGWQR